MGNIATGILYAFFTLLIIAWTWITWCNWLIQNENAKSTTVKPSYLKGADGSDLLGFIDSLSLVLLSWAGFTLLVLLSFAGLWLTYLAFKGVDGVAMVKDTGRAVRNTVSNMDPSQYKIQQQYQQPAQYVQYQPQQQYIAPSSGMPPMGPPPSMQV